MGTEPHIHSQAQDSTAHEVKRLDFAAAATVAETRLHCISHPFRQNILKIVNDNIRLNISDLCVKLKSSQSKTSVHLGLLRKANIVKTYQNDRIVYYSLNSAYIALITEQLAGLQAPPK